MNTWFVNGYGQREKLINKLGRDGDPEAIVLMGDFLFSHELIKLLKQANKEGKLFESKLKEIGDKGKERITPSLDLEAILWMNIISVLYKRGVMVFILKSNFEFFYKQNGMKTYFSFEKGLRKYLGKKSLTCHTVDLPVSIQIIDTIRVYDYQGFKLVFWPKNVPYQDDFSHFNGKNVVLITDGSLDSLTYFEKANASLVISPELVTTGISQICIGKNITVVDL
jgi:hypothetical protein